MELLVASLFSGAAPLAPPSTGLAGFFRFLLLLSSHDWATAPLVVDPQGELSATDRASIGEAFSISRDRGEHSGCGSLRLTFIVRRCYIMGLLGRQRLSAWELACNPGMYVDVLDSTYRLVV